VFARIRRGARTARRFESDQRAKDRAHAAIADYTVFSNAVQEILAVNGAPSGFITSRAVVTALDQLVDTLGRPIRPVPSFERPTKFATNQVSPNLGTGQNESEAYIADWMQATIAIRTETKLEVSRVAADVFPKLGVGVRIYLRADFQLMHPDQFCVITGIGRSGG